VREREKKVEITKQDVEKVARLARLAITPSEKDTFAKQLSQILTHVEKLKQYDTKGIEPTTTVLGQVNVFREDIVRPSLPIDKALANAPEREADGFCVPRILEER
jgi:aspartyl-tRNA(Asn)/glutamyl-tRNA(Gln) amidotransferase subunit C